MNNSSKKLKSGLKQNQTLNFNERLIMINEQCVINNLPITTNYQLNITHYPLAITTNNNS